MVANLLENLIAAYNFNLPSPFVDLTGNGHNLTNVATTSIAGVINEGRDFNGSTASLQTTTLLNWFNTFDTSDKSWAFWWNPDDDTNFQGVSIIRDSDNNPQFELLATGIGNSKNTQRLIIRDDSGIGPLVSGTRVVSNGEWHLMIATWGYATGELSMYIDDSFEASSTTVTGTFSQITTADPFTLGCRNTGGSCGSFYDGKTDIVALWDKKLTSDDRSAYWNSGNGLEYPFAAVDPELSSLGPFFMPLSTANKADIKSNHSTGNHTFFQSTGLRSKRNEVFYFEIN